jgi:hypothetical protein
VWQPPHFDATQTFLPRIGLPVSFSSFATVVVAGVVAPVLPVVVDAVVAAVDDVELLLFDPPQAVASSATLASTITAATFTAVRLRDVTAS